MKVSLNRLQVEQALQSRGTDLATFIEAGQRQGKTIKEIAEDLCNLTGVPFTPRTLYRWAERLEKAS